MDTEHLRYSINDVAERIRVIREYDFAGIALFSYEGLKVGNALQYLGNLAYFEAPELVCEPLLSREAIDYPIPEQNWPAEFNQTPAPQHPSPEQSQIPAPTHPGLGKSQTSALQPLTIDIQSVEASFGVDQDMYVIHLNIPEEGRWLWELHNEKQKRVYHRYRYYSKGDNEDYWDGMLDSDAYILAGRYKLILDSGSQLYQADVNLGKLLHE